MNKYQKIQHQATMKVMNHIGVNAKEKGFGSAYRAMRKTLKAMSGTIEWMQKRARKDGVDFGELQMDYNTPGVVRIVVHGVHGENAKPYVLTEIRKTEG